MKSKEAYAEAGYEKKRKSYAKGRGTKIVSDETVGTETAHQPKKRKQLPENQNIALKPSEKTSSPQKQPAVKQGKSVSRQKKRHRTILHRRKRRADRKSVPFGFYSSAEWVKSART